MECPSCKSDNPDDANVCRSCGNELNPTEYRSPKMLLATGDGPSPVTDWAQAHQSSPSSSNIKDETIKRLRSEYALGTKNALDKTSQSLHNLCARLRTQKRGVREVIEEIAKILFRIFQIKEVAIGLRDPIDGLYKYEVVVGFRKEVEAVHRDIRYACEDFSGTGKYVGTKISDITIAYLSEDQTYEEEIELTFSRPQLLRRETRKSVDHCLEGDYFDTHILDRHGNLIGWIEFSGTKDGKMPEANMIKWTEILATFLGLYLPKEVRYR